MSEASGITLGAEIDLGWVSRLEEHDRAQNPEYWALLDKVAAIIDPTAWPGEAFDNVGPDAKPIDWDSYPEVRYRRSQAQQKAREVMAVLAIGRAREFDWAGFFAEMAKEGR